jgi:hypothetical protein
MGTLKYLLRRLRGDNHAVKPVNVDDADSSSTPRLQHPEKYDSRALDMITRADVTTTGLGDFWPGSASNSPLPVPPHMSRREAREWELLRAQDAERQRKQGSE